MLCSQNRQTKKTIPSRHRVVAKGLAESLKVMYHLYVVKITTTALPISKANFHKINERTGLESQHKCHVENHNLSGVYETAPKKRWESRRNSFSNGVSPLSFGKNVESILRGMCKSKDVNTILEITVPCWRTR